MALSSSLLAYQDCLDFMERAMDEERGARMYFRAESEAEHWRMRCNYARKLHRDQNKQVYEPGDKMYGMSEYDPLMFTIRQSPDGYWVYAKKMELDTTRVEPIPDEDYITEIHPEDISHPENHE